MTKARLHEIVESVKEDYLLNVVEESTNEVEVLRTKKFLNETASIVETMLFEAEDGNGSSIIDAVRNYVTQAKAAAQNKLRYANTRIRQTIAPESIYPKNPADLSPVPTYGQIARAYGQMYNNLPAAAKYGIPAAALAGTAGAGYAGYEMMQPEDFMDQVQDTVSDIADRASDVVNNIGG